jgi:hypothetical protein
MSGVDRQSLGRCLGVALSERTAGLPTLRTWGAWPVVIQLGGVQSSPSPVDPCRDARSSPFLLLEGHPILPDEGNPFSQLLRTSFVRRTGPVQASSLYPDGSPGPIDTSVFLGPQGKRRIPPTPNATPSDPSKAMDLLRQVLRKGQRPSGWERFDGT